MLPIPSIRTRSRPPSSEAAAHDEPTARRGQGGGIWWLLLLLVIVFGYLSAARRASLGRFAEQVADIIHDFRGYDPSSKLISWWRR